MRKLRLEGLLRSKSLSSLLWTGTKAITLHVLHNFLSVAWRVQVVGSRQEQGLFCCSLPAMRH